MKMEYSYLSFLGLDGILRVEKTRGGHLPQILTGLVRLVIGGK